MMKRTTGLALIVVIGILGVLAALAVAFVAMAQLERRASEQRVNAARAYLLARSGIEDALARLDLGQDPAYKGEDWDADGALSTFEAAQEIAQRGILNVADCPVRHAMRPSYFARLSPGSPDAALLSVDGRKRGYSGLLSGEHAPEGNTYALKVSSSNAGIHINGGALDDQDRDPDGPGTPPEGAPLLPNKVPDHRDASMEGPNGFLVRLLNNLDAVVTNGATSNLGVQVVGARPVGGYKSLDELKPILGQVRFDQFKPTLTLYAWVDPEVVKPQPMDGRPHRWEDIDDAHRIGAEAAEISGVHHDPAIWTWTTEGVSGTLLSLNPDLSGRGTEAEPWTQTITTTNCYERTVTYPVTWERDFVYAWTQLRPAPLQREPRAPVSLHAAPPEVLAAVFLGLRGAYLESWDGSAGWDGGFSWYQSTATYPYPDPATEDTPWHRTRLDYGATFGTPSRPWYGQEAYDPHAAPTARGRGGRPLIQAAPLGRLRETPPVTRPQALAVAAQLRAWGPLRSWERFGDAVRALPRWEDVDDDGFLDGPPYLVQGDGLPTLRRIYRGEDWDSDGLMQREIFAEGPAGWQEALLAPGQGKADLGPGKVPGLTFIQKDVLKAMANPNTDLNDFNPDANLFKEVDKTDLAGPGPAPGAYAHTTELALDEAAGPSVLRAVGRVCGRNGALLASTRLGLVARISAWRRDTTQEDFAPLYALAEAPAAPYPLAGGLPLVSHPEPPAEGHSPAAYDGQISLGFVGAGPGPNGETLRGELFGTADATSGDAAVPDRRGPALAPLLGAPLLGAAPGQVLADGVMSERDRTLMFRMEGIFTETSDMSASFYLGFWVKPNWLPEASPRPHALLSLSPVVSESSFVLPPPHPVRWLNPYDVRPGFVPLDDIATRPVGLYFVPGRNNAWQDAMGPYVHGPESTRGRAWPCRALLWGQTHSFFASDSLNRKGLGWLAGLGSAAPASRIEALLLLQRLTAKVPTGSPAAPTTLEKPLGRLEGRRWSHVGLPWIKRERGAGPIVLGRRPASVDENGGGWNSGGLLRRTRHLDGSANHLRFGELAAFENLNYAADATFANLRAGWTTAGAGLYARQAENRAFLERTALLGRYLKEHGASYASSPLPDGARPRRITWTEIPCELWFDENGDGWLGDPPVEGGASVKKEETIAGTNIWRPDLSLTISRYAGAVPQNDRDGNGLRDVRIDLEVWDDLGTDGKSDDRMLARFEDPAAVNRTPAPRGRLYYKAIFVNEWDPDTRANHPLDVTPFLDDVTLSYMEAWGPVVLAWGADDGE